MNLPLVISRTKQPTTIKQCVQYEQEVPTFIINTKKTNSTKNYVVQGKKIVKRKRKIKQQKSVRLSDCEAALNIYSIANGRNKQRKVGKNFKNLSNSQDNSVIYCTVRNLISSYSSSKIYPVKTKLRLTSSSEKTHSSTKQSNTKETSEIKRQSCPPPILRSKSLIGKEVKFRKVYYSEAHSHMLSGVPCAPPVSPINDVLIAFEIVPSMADIKSQQTIKSKLRNLEIARGKENEKLKARFVKEEKRREKEEKETIKEQRRAEIYALNEVMTQLERTKFLKFIKEKYNGTTTISLKA